jgi:phage shock protein PspC (stress-responsive transcriptional regulator)
LAEYYGWDVTAVRLVFVFGSFVGFSTEIAYIVLWIVMPDN